MNLEMKRVPQTRTHFEKKNDSIFKEDNEEGEIVSQNLANQQNRIKKSSANTTVKPFRGSSATTNSLGLNKVRGITAHNSNEIQPTLKTSLSNGKIGAR